MQWLNPFRCAVSNTSNLESLDPLGMPEVAPNQRLSALARLKEALAAKTPFKIIPGKPFNLYHP
jgi:hypothetical protein